MTNHDATGSRAATLKNEITEGLTPSEGLTTWPVGTRVQIIHTEPHTSLVDTNIHLVQTETEHRFWVNDRDLDA